MVRMTCYAAKYQGKLIPSAEVVKMDYFEFAKKHLTSPVDRLIFDDLKAKGLIE